MSPEQSNPNQNQRLEELETRVHQLEEQNRILNEHNLADSHRIEALQRDNKIQSAMIFGIMEGLRRAGIHYTYKAIDKEDKEKQPTPADVKAETDVLPDTRQEYHIQYPNNPS